MNTFSTNSFNYTLLFTTWHSFLKIISGLIIWSEETFRPKIETMFTKEETTVFQGTQKLDFARKKLSNLTKTHGLSWYEVFSPLRSWFTNNCLIYPFVVRLKNPRRKEKKNLKANAVLFWWFLFHGCLMITINIFNKCYLATILQIMFLV